MSATPSLIPVFTGTIQEQETHLCNARDLWAFVESKQEFANWIKARIEKYEFIEGEDFTVDKSVNGRATVIDYHLTLDTAKELAMVEANAKGRQVRRYFIACERAAREACVAPKALPNPINRTQAGELATLIAERFPDGKQRPYAWGRFNNHFRLATYKDLLAEDFDAACTYIRQMPRKGETVNPDQAALDAARQVLSNQRYMVRFGTSAEEPMVLISVPQNASLLTNEQIIKAIGEPGGLFTLKELPEIIHAAASRLKAA